MGLTARLIRCDILPKSSAVAALPHPAQPRYGPPLPPVRAVCIPALNQAQHNPSVIFRDRRGAAHALLFTRKRLESHSSVHPRWRECERAALHRLARRMASEDVSGRSRIAYRASVTARL